MADRGYREGWSVWRLIAALLRDRAGNVLILTGFMLIPLTALIGSSIDIGRVYVARSRMQQACDAASLAGRWAASAGQSTTDITAEATKYFNFNFKQNQYGTASFTPVIGVTGTTTKTVTITASTTMPMSIMTVFKFRPMTVSASCTAMQDFVNTDIVLVLDVTGSMMCLPSDDESTCDNYVGAHTGDLGSTTVRSTSRMQGLRDAVMALYDQLSPIQTQLQAAGMRLRYSVVPFAMTVNTGKLIYAANNSYLRTTNLTYKTCTRYSGGYCSTAADSAPVNRDANWVNNTWSGCIEERQTTSTLTASTSTIPAAAFDLDIDKIPDTTPATRWKPYDPSVENSNWAPFFNTCPAAAKRLTTWARSDLQTYVNALAPNGMTYHDIGMIWGARMISSAGIFADSPTTYGGMPTNKFIIFLTDGTLETAPYVYTAYGTEQFDLRVTGGATSEDEARHRQRFKLMCSAVKNRGVSVWVVAFAQSLDTDLTNCASNSGQASTSANSADLIAKFREIGKNIGALRLTQ